MGNYNTLPLLRLLPLTLTCFLLYLQLVITESMAELLSQNNHHHSSIVGRGSGHGYRSGRARLDTPETNFIEIGEDSIFDGIPLQRLDLELDNDVNMNMNTNANHFPMLSNAQGLYDLDNAGRFEFDKEQSQHQCQHQQIPNNEIQLLIQSENRNNNINSHDNSNNKSSNTKKYRTLKTGTTIVGIKTSNSIIIAADTRATEGSVVADKLCEKVHQLSQNIWCCGAGTSADLDALTRKIRYRFLLKSMIDDSIGNGNLNDSSIGNDNERSNSNSNYSNYQMEGVEEDVGHPLGQASISAVCTMIRESLYKGGGEIGANLVLGGYDQCTQSPILTAIHPHGSIDVVPYTALGSGGLAAMGVLESRYHVDISLEEGIMLVKDAVRAGIENDLGSGSQIDLCIIDEGGVRYSRGVVEEETLLLSEGENDINEQLFLRHTDANTDTNEIVNANAMMQKRIKSMNGVNGFGSLPYVIKSRTKLLEDEEVIEERGREWLKKIIDF